MTDELQLPKYEWTSREKVLRTSVDVSCIDFRHIEGRKCPYSNVPDMYNMCQYAHSEEELDEWKERYEWRQMKRDMARQEKVFSFMDELLEEYQSAEQGIRVVCVVSKRTSSACIVVCLSST